MRTIADNKNSGQNIWDHHNPYLFVYVSALHTTEVTIDYLPLNVIIAYMYRGDCRNDWN